MGKRWFWELFFIAIFGGSVFDFAASDPQINLLNQGCSQYNASNVQNFFANLNATFSDLRNQLSQEKKLFATAQEARSSDPVYAMVQCRGYLSTADCVACYDAAVSLIRNCSAANGARVIYDGCFLRYESNNFYDQTTLPGNVQVCGNRTATQASAFQTVAQALLQDLELATPRINGYFAASTRQVSGGNSTVYGVAQCAATITQSGCQDCLTVGYGNIHSCLPEADGRAVDAACFLRYSETPFFADNQTTNIMPFLGGGGSSKKKAIIGGVVGGGGFVLLIIGLFLWYQLYRKSISGRKGNILGVTELQGPVTYKYNDLKSATKNFSEENKLGEGGFGEVFKGTLRNGNIVAVKKLNVSPGRANEEFNSEVKLISNVHHRNLVRLLGCASKGAELLLVHEYMANGSLDRFLYGDERGRLNWKQRFDIIFGTARGLAYLHEQFHVCIIHRDIKPSNILLDDDFQPKIADFGLAKLLPGDRSHVSTKFAGTFELYEHIAFDGPYVPGAPWIATRAKSIERNFARLAMKGNAFAILGKRRFNVFDDGQLQFHRGYTAPEYALQGHLSEKVDTYSFGIVVLEIVSGKKSNDVVIEPVADYLLEQAWKLHECDMHLKLVDESLDPSAYNAEEVKRVIQIALLCTQSQAHLRPTMSEVVVMLLSDRSVERRTPARASLTDNERRFFRDTSSSSGNDGLSTSNATASITEFTGR